LSDKDGSPNAPCHLSQVLPLQAAVRAGQAAVVQVLLEAKADPSLARDPPLLHLAVEMGQKEVVERLLDSGCDPAARNPRGRSPMALAAREDRLDIMELLISRYNKIERLGTCKGSFAVVVVVVVVC